MIVLAACTWIDDGDWEDRLSDMDRDGHDADEDCDDDDEDVNPEANEVHANGVDDDCDGWDYLGVLTPGSGSCVGRVREGGLLEARWSMEYDGEDQEDEAPMLVFASDSDAAVTLTPSFSGGDLLLRGVEWFDDGEQGENQRLARVEDGERGDWRLTVDAREDRFDLTGDDDSGSMDISVDDPVSAVCAPYAWPGGVELTGQITVYAGD